MVYIMIYPLGNVYNVLVNVASLAYKKKIRRLRTVCKSFMYRQIFVRLYYQYTTGADINLDFINLSL